LASTAASLRDTILTLPIVDTHTHIWHPSRLPQPLTGYDLFELSAYHRIWWTVTGFLSKRDLAEGKKLTDWASLSAALKTMRTIAFHRIFWRGLRELYRIEADELDEAAFEELNNKLIEAYRDPRWLLTILKEKSGLEIMCVDWPWEFDRSFMTPIVRLDDYIMFGRKERGENIVRKHGEERTADLGGLMDCLRKDFRKGIDEGAAAAKARTVSARSLQYDEVSEAQARKAFEEIKRGSPGESAVKALGDYIVDEMAKLCVEYDVPFQIHTGPSGGVSNVTHYGNPLELNSLIRRHRDTRFDLLHVGGPFVSESREMAIQFPNVTLNLTGIFARDFLRRMLDELIEFVPQGKLLWGTDVNLAETAYGVTLSFREVLWEFLEDRIRSGYLSPTTAEEFARGIMRDNALRTMRLAAAGTEDRRAEARA